MSMRKFKVVKYSGEEELFDDRKMFHSLRRAGASIDVAENIIDKVVSTAVDGMTTKKLFRQAFNLLNKTDEGTALKYNLKQSIYQLGPTGFPFEKFIAGLLKANGYHTLINQRIRGASKVTYEIDIVAQNDTEKLLVECKFHSRPGIISHMNTVLYCKARFDDIKQGVEPLKSKNFTRLMLVSSTRFTHSVKSYSKLYDVKLLGWRHPRGQGIGELIEQKKLYPITILTGLDNRTKDQMLLKGYVFANDLINNTPKFLSKKTSVSISKLTKLREQALLLNK